MGKWGLHLCIYIVQFSSVGLSTLISLTEDRHFHTVKIVCLGQSHSPTVTALRCGATAGTDLHRQHRGVLEAPAEVP